MNRAYRRQLSLHHPSSGLSCQMWFSCSRQFSSNAFFTMSEISAAALLVVVGEPFSSDHKDLIWSGLPKVSVYFHHFTETGFLRNHFSAGLSCRAHRTNKAQHLGVWKKVWQQVMREMTLSSCEMNINGRSMWVLSFQVIFQNTKTFSQKKCQMNHWMNGWTSWQRGSIKLLPGLSMILLCFLMHIFAGVFP